MKRNLFIIIAILVVPVILFCFAGPKSSENAIGYTQIVNSKKPIVLDFSSTLCLECKKLDKVLTPIEPEYKDKITFQKILINTNNPDSEKLMKKYNVTVVPTLVFIDKNGKVIKRTEGCIPENELKGYLDKLANG